MILREGAPNTARLISFACGIEMVSERCYQYLRESGMEDQIALPFVFLPVSIAGLPEARSIVLMC